MDVFHEIERMVSKPNISILTGAEGIRRVAGGVNIVYLSRAST